RRALLRRHAELGARGEVARLVEEMRQLATKTRQLEEAARREDAEQSLRVTQLSILREISRTIVGQLDPDDLAAGVSAQLQTALGYDRVTVTAETPTEAADEDGRVIVCAIRDAQGRLGALVVDNRASGRAIDPRERELLEMLSEYLAIALRNSRLYGEIADAKRSFAKLIASAGDAIIAIVRDITAQREVEQQLHQSEKLTALGQLAGGIAHDFNNLPQAILGYAQLMKQNPKDAEFMSRSLNVVEAAALDGSETVRRIQTFARLRPEEAFVAVDVNQIVHDAVAITRPRWEEKRAHDRRPLHLRLETGTVEPIHGRPAALTETMTNLILNALDAMPDGGTLTIATRQERGGSVTIIVGDTGVGMSEVVRQRVFEPFFTTKSEGEGTGLGLSMAYSIVRRHGGDIRVDSEPGRGATFTLTFPAARAQAKAAGAPGLAIAWQPARVLVVDDEPKVLATLTDLLRSVGHTVTSASSGAAALAAYAPGRYEVVLTNLGMAGMNGWEFAERLRAVDQNVAVLFITGWGPREGDQGRLEKLKVRRCLFKPVRPSDLDAAIQEALV